MKKRNFFYSFLCILILILGFFIGRNFYSYWEELNISVYVNSEKQIFRDSNGSLLNPLKKNNIIYLPINGLGSYLDYMTITDYKGISLYEVENANRKILSDLNTETLNGDIVDSSIFQNADYTVIFLWATHCRYCKDTISDFINLNEYIKENNIQFYSVVTDLEYLKFKDEILQEDINVINSIIGEFNITETLLVDSVIERELIGSSVSLPKLIIFDNLGNIIKIVDENITSEQFKSIFDLIQK